MRKIFPLGTVLAALLLHGASALAAEPVRHIAIHVQPYYAAAERADLEQNPYQAIFMDRFTAKPGNRAESLKRAIRTLRQNVDTEQAYLADPKRAADFQATRSKNEADAKFCWK